MAVGGGLRASGGGLPLLTASIRRAGGVFKATPEDFVVEELPAYEPNGEGEHLFLWIEKRGLSTPEAARLITRHLGLQEREASWAGLKDKQAVTRQYLCVPAKAGGALATFAADGLTVLRAAKHRNKLKAGHLKGNRFSLVLREVKDPAAARECLALLAAQGIPNYFGEQRFGAAGDNPAQGKAILLAGGRHRDRFQRKLFLSAYQSELFNRVLARRLEAGTFARALQGDVLKKHLTGGEFVCEAPETDQPRVDAFEVSPTGPMYGPSMRAPAGEVLAAEQQVLAEEGLTPDAFAAGGGETEGARRLLRVPLQNLTVDGEGELHLTFELPAGSYATVLLRELLKTDLPLPAAAGRGPG